MMAVGMFLAPIALAALVVLVLFTDALRGLASGSGNADPKGRGELLGGLCVLGLACLLYFGGGGRGWTDALIALAIAFAVSAVAWCCLHVVVRLLRDAKTRWGCLAFLVAGLAAAAYFLYPHLGAGVIVACVALPFALVALAREDADERAGGLTLVAIVALAVLAYIYWDSLAGLLPDRWGGGCPDAPCGEGSL